MDFKYDKVSFNADYAASISEADFIESNWHLWPGKSDYDRKKHLKRVHKAALEMTGKTKQHDNGSGNATEVAELGHRGGDSGGNPPDE